MTVSSKAIPWLSLAFFLLLGLVVYSNTLEVPFYFDDGPNIRQNHHIRLTRLNLGEIAGAAFKGPCRTRPVANASFALNYYFHEYRVAGYHWINIGIHGLTGFFLFVVMKQTLLLRPWRVQQERAPTQEQSQWVAFIAAALWLVHPVHTQSVTYIVQRMTAMAGMFYVLCLLCYVKGRLAARHRKRGWAWFLAAAIAGLMALGSKEIAATLPLFILLYEWYFLQDLRRDGLKRAAPYLLGIVLSSILLVFLYLGQNPVREILADYGSRDFSLHQRVLTQFRVVVHYIGLLLYPHPSRLSLDYDFPPSLSLTDPVTTLLALGFILGCMAVAILRARRNRLLSFAILWFIGNLVIESSVIALEMVYEHRIYLPSMFFFLPLVSAAFENVRRRRVVAALAGAAVALLCFWTYERNLLWQDNVAFWQDAVRKSPNKARTHHNLGIELAGRGRFKEAIAHYTEALRLKPSYVEAHDNLGNALVDSGDIDGGIAHYVEALRLKPRFPEALNNLGNALAKLGRLEEAIARYRQALELYPAYPMAHNNLGNVLARQGKLEEAVIQYAQALNADPTYATAHNNLGNALAALGKIEEAIAHFTEALKIDPTYSNARQNLDRALRLADTAPGRTTGAATDTTGSKAPVYP